MPERPDDKLLLCDNCQDDFILAVLRWNPDADSSELIEPYEGL